MSKDMVNHPSHYQGEGGLETIDAMVGQHGAFAGALWCHLTAEKYLARLGKKDDAVQEINKAIWYLTKMRELIITHNINYGSTQEMGIERG